MLTYVGTAGLKRENQFPQPLRSRTVPRATGDRHFPANAGASAMPFNTVHFAGVSQ